MEEYTKLTKDELVNLLVERDKQLQSEKCICNHYAQSNKKLEAKLKAVENILAL